MEEEKNIQSKKNVKRSPNFPIIGLKEAIEKTKIIYQADGRAGSPKLSAYKNLGFKGEHGKSLGVLSAMKKFGLIREIENTIFLTKEAEIILIASDELKKADAIKICAIKPEIYAKLWEKYSATGLPSDSTLKDVLIFEYEFNENAVDGFIENFKESINFANLRPGEIIDNSQSGEKEMDNFKDETGAKDMFEHSGKTNVTDKKALIQDYVIPRKGDKLTILRLEKPVSNEDIDLITKWLELLRSTIVDED